jgi:hypothetical protein
MRTFSQTQPKKELDKDRVPLSDGMKISISMVEVTDKTRFDKIAHIEGTLLDTKNTPFKGYTTSRVIVSQLEEILKIDGNPKGGLLKEPVAAVVKKVKASNSGGTYLSLADPGAA